MTTEPASFKNLSGPLRIGLILAGGGGLLTALWAVVNELPLWVGGAFVLGITVVGLLLVLYAQLLKWRKARRARPMEQQVLRSTGAGQRGISDPGELAKVDELRRKFEEGIATFRAAGKSLYSLPWYLILGEPGSGKTEAVRHCGIGFPPGLHDRYQGVGGTINMNWWFTDHGVIIDTAGRLMFEEAHSGGTQEWKEFLNLLKKSRPSCPVNGALLTIPSDSLIKESTEEIERKASQIAQQFDAIQRTLDVRFPVYIVVTKSDLINGFREFFDNVADPQLQHQILGWSNPGEMDNPYDPAFVDKYLEEMKVRLYRARLARLGELLCDDSEEQERPTEEALYAFPQAFEQLGPRLKRYLDLIFSVGSQWSCKPLFFRGIYFTSSMQEGAALDQDLATLLGVPVESLPEGPVWRRDRAYFLRDLFTTKVFSERGLVTSATNARRQYARRRAAVMGSAAVGLVLLIALTIYGSIEFGRSVDKLQESLKPASDPMSLEIVSLLSGQLYQYMGGNKQDMVLPLHDYFDDLTRQALCWERGEGILCVFQPAVRLAKKDAKAREAVRRVYRDGVLRPLLSAAAETMKVQKDSAWAQDSKEFGALRQLIAVRAERSFDDGESAKALLNSLMEYVRPEDHGSYTGHEDNLARPLSDLYDFPPHPQFDTKLVGDMDDAIEKGIGLFNAYWSDPRDRHAALRTIKEVVGCLTGMGRAGGAADADSFESIEKRLIAVDSNAGSLEKWLEDFQALEKVKSRVDKAKGGLGQCPELRQAWDARVQDYLDDMNSTYTKLMEAFGGRPDPNLVRLQDGLKACEGSFNDKSFKDRLPDVDRGFWVGDLYSMRFSMYQVAADCHKKLEKVIREDVQGLKKQDVDRLVTIVQGGRALAKEAQDKVEGIRSGHSPEEPHVKGAYRAAGTVIGSGDRSLCQEVVSWWLRTMPKDASGLARHIQETGSSYDRTMTACVFQAWHCVNEAARALQDPKSVEDFGRLDTEYGKYAYDYIDHWLKDRGPRMLKDKILAAGDWRTRHEQIGQMRAAPEDVYDTLVRVRNDLRRCLEPVAEYSRDNNTVSQFERAWNSLTDRSESFYRDKCYRVLSNWAKPDHENPQSVRQILLGLTPIEFQGGYLVSASSAPVASPDCYWHQLVITSLGILADEVERNVGARSEDMKIYERRFPLSRSSNDDHLTRDDVLRIGEISQQVLRGEYAAGTIGAKAEVSQPDIDALLGRLRDAVADASWAQKVSVLPPPNGSYWCRVKSIETDKPGLVRMVKISEGEESIKWDDLTKTWRNIKGDPDDFLRYNCSNDAVTLAFYAYPEENALIGKPISFPGPWPWHRMLEKVDPKDGTYDLERVVQVNNTQVTVTMRLRFSKENKPEVASMEIFPPKER